MVCLIVSRAIEKYVYSYYWSRTKDFQYVVYCCNNDCSKTCLVFVGWAQAISLSNNCFRISWDEKLFDADYMFLYLTSNFTQKKIKQFYNYLNQLSK